jgi:predicted membrane protein
MGGAMMGNRAFLGILLVLVGAVFILNNYIDIFSSLSAWWPMLIILIGVVQIAKRSAALLTSLTIIAAGAVFLAMNLGYIPGRLLFPIALILVGCWFIFNRVIGQHKYVDEDRLNHFILFSGLETRNITQNFTGGSIAAIFGGAEIDLRNATLSEQGAELELTAVFGGVEISVPQNWKVQITGVPLFGGWENRTRFTNEGGTNSPLFKIRCLALFGGAEVKN